jgi:hypothetical protein
MYIKKLTVLSHSWAELGADIRRYAQPSLSQTRAR